MSIRPETAALLDRLLGGEREIDAALEALRDLICNLVWAGDDLHGQSDLVAWDNLANLQLHRKAWEEIGGEAAISHADVLIDQIARLAREDDAS